MAENHEENSLVNRMRLSADRVSNFDLERGFSDQSKLLTDAAIDLRQGANTVEDLLSKTVIFTARVTMVNERRAFFHIPNNYAPIILTRAQYDQLDKPKTIEVAIRKAG